MSPAEYRRRAADFYELAEATVDSAQRAWLIEMAQSWLKLAELAERNLTSDIWYETPPQQQASHSPQQQQQPQPKKKD